MLFTTSSTINGQPSLVYPFRLDKATYERYKNLQREHRVSPGFMPVLMRLYFRKALDYAEQVTYRGSKLKAYQVIDKSVLDSTTLTLITTTQNKTPEEAATAERPDIQIPADDTAEKLSEKNPESFATVKCSCGNCTCGNQVKA